MLLQWLHGKGHPKVCNAVPKVQHQHSWQRHVGCDSMQLQHRVICALRLGHSELTSLGAMRELKVIRFSGGILPALDRPCTTTVSPLTTCRDEVAVLIGDQVRIASKLDCHGLYLLNSALQPSSCHAERPEQTKDCRSV